MIKFCGCTADQFGNTAGAKFQDKKYGVGRRIFTDNSPANKERCTVCGKG